MRWNYLLLGVGLVLAACGDGSGAAPKKGKKKGGAPEGLSRRALKAEHKVLVQRLAEAVVRKDYKAAYQEMSESYKTDVGWTEFESSIRRYRESAEQPPTYELWATEDDPKKISKDSTVELFVPAPMRDRILEEVAVHFSVKADKDGVEGFWALICWIVDEGGTPRILNYYQDD